MKLAPDKPGPIQRQVLEALALSMADGKPVLTLRELAAALDITETSVLGALSGMRKMAQRHWVVEVDEVSNYLRDHARRQFQITSNGMYALLYVGRTHRSRREIVRALRRDADLIKPVVVLGDDDSIYLTDRQLGQRDALRAAADAIEQGRL